MSRRGIKNRVVPLPELTPTDEAWLDLSLLVYQADQRFRDGRTLTPFQLRKLRKACAALLPADSGEGC